MAAGLLALKMLPRDAMDMLNLFGRARRRQRYQRMVSQGFDPFTGAGPTAPPVQTAESSRWVQTRSVASQPPDTQSARELELRRDIAAACARNDLPEAARKYLQLVQVADAAVLSRQNQLDVANQLMAGEQYPAAADAYERFLKHYPSYEHVADIHLMLGLIYGRYLYQYDRAEQLLQFAIERVRDKRKVEMARAELQAVRQRRNL